MIRCSCSRPGGGLMFDIRDGRKRLCFILGIYRDRKMERHFSRVVNERIISTLCTLSEDSTYTLDSRASNSAEGPVFLKSVVGGLLDMGNLVLLIASRWRGDLRGCFAARSCQMAAEMVRRRVVKRAPPRRQSSLPTRARLRDADVAWTS